MGLPLELHLANDLVPSMAAASALLLLLSLALLLLRSKGSDSAPVKGALASGGVVAVAGGQQPERDDKPVCHLLFGTQTGTAERFAKDLRMQLSQRYGDSMRFEVADLEEYEAQERLPGEALALFLVATYGDGEPTDNATTFYDWLMYEARVAEEEGATPLQVSTRRARAA